MAPSVSRRTKSRTRPSGQMLAAVLIARDEGRCIARCLDSVRPWVDRVMLLDTGSRDDTADVARRHGATVQDFAWQGDFSIARNRALEIADADWNLVIDADEWIVAGGELLRRWCEGPARLGRVCQHNSSDLPRGMIAGGSLPASRDWVTRILPRGVRYEGRVHEQVSSSLPRERLDLHLGHDGYLAQQLSAKSGRNQSLLTLELRDRPDDPYILFQLGKEAEGRSEFEAAAERYARSLRLAPATATWMHELLIRYLHCLGQSGRVVQALDVAERKMEAWADSPDFFFVLGDLLLARAMSDPSRAVKHWLPLACEAWERCLRIGERPELEGSVSGRGSDLARHNLELVRSQIALVAA